MLQIKGLAAIDQLFGESPHLRPSQVRVRLAAACLGGAVIVLHAICMPRTLLPGDDAASVLLGLTLGIGDRPGAPLHYLTVNGAASILGFIPPTAAAHFMSVLCAGAGAVFLLGMLREATGGRIAAGAGAALIISFHPFVRSEATIASSTSLIWMLIAAHFWMLWAYAGRRRPSGRAFLAACLLQGCMVSVDPTLIALLPATIVVFAARGQWLAGHPGAWLGGIGLFLLGLLPWSYYAARKQSEVYLGTPVAPDGLADFEDYLIGAPIWGELGATLHRGAGPVAEDLLWKSFALLANFSPLVLALALIGLLHLLRSRRVWRARAGLSLGAVAVGGAALLIAGKSMGGAELVAAVLTSMLAACLFAPPHRKALAALPFAVALPFVLSPQASSNVFLLPAVVAIGLFVALGIEAAGRIRGRTTAALVAIVFASQILFPGTPTGWEGVDSAADSPERPRTGVGIEWPLACLFGTAPQASAGLGDLELKLWEFVSRPILLVCEPELQPLFWAHQSIRGQFFNYWFVENTSDPRTAWHPDLGRVVLFRDIDKLVFDNWKEREVLVISRQTGTPTTPPGMVFEVKSKIQLLGDTFYIWRLAPMAEEPLARTSI